MVLYVQLARLVGGRRLRSPRALGVFHRATIIGNRRRKLLISDDVSLSASHTVHCRRVDDRWLHAKSALSSMTSVACPIQPRRATGTLKRTTQPQIHSQCVSFEKINRMSCRKWTCKTFVATSFPLSTTRSGHGLLLFPFYQVFQQSRAIVKLEEFFQRTAQNHEYWLD